MSLQAGLEALKEGRYRDAVQILKDFCQYYTQPGSKDYLRAQMGLVKAYHRLDDTEQAIALTQKLATNDNPQISSWAKQALQTLSGEPSGSSTPQPPSPAQPANRAAKGGVKLALASTAGNLALASGVTISLLFGMVLVLSLALVFIVDSNNPVVGLAIAVSITVIFNLAAFFLSPFLMDLTQKWLYDTRWVALSEIETLSPEAARVIERVCQQKKIKVPRLGIIDDQNPTAFTYGSLPNRARLLVSQGLFTYLDDDEVATVYAHELGHIVHWDFAVMTLASTLVQITYLIYIAARRLGRSGNDKLKNAAGTAALVAYVFYIVGTYLLLYLSRTREYFADHFAAETTGNPNALSRALVKIAYGIVEEGKRASEPSRLIEGTRALGIYDPKAAASAGTAYRVAAQPRQIGRIFLWDLFNPWGWWMELSSTHPLTGKRVRALSTYAEQLGLPTEFDMGRVVGESRNLSKKKLYSNFIGDLLLYCAMPIGFFMGLAVGFAIKGAFPTAPVSLAIIGLGLGTLLRTFVMFPSFKQAPESDILKLMSDPYASPLRGQPVKLHGELIGRGDAGYQFGSDLKVQDRTGMIYLHYASRFGPIGNFLFGMNRVKKLLGAQVGVTGWFRRGVAPWVDITQLVTESGTTVNSFHRLWSFILAGVGILFGVFLLVGVGGLG
ncbi:MAG TPA: M48 family metalloprotease [Coleofasciculaceae cyanobacterium]|jgi:Zn-dependent protease with chaperone function